MNLVVGSVQAIVIIQDCNHRTEVLRPEPARANKFKITTKEMVYFLEIFLNFPVTKMMQSRKEITSSKTILKLEKVLAYYFCNIVL